MLNPKTEQLIAISIAENIVQQFRREASNVFFTLPSAVVRYYSKNEDVNSF